MADPPLILPTPTPTITAAPNAGPFERGRVDAQNRARNTPVPDEKAVQKAWEKALTAIRQVARQCRAAGIRVEV